MSDLSAPCGRHDFFPLFLSCSLASHGDWEPGCYCFLRAGTASFTARPARAPCVEPYGLTSFATEQSASLVSPYWKPSRFLLELCSLHSTGMAAVCPAFTPVNGHCVPECSKMTLSLPLVLLDRFPFTQAWQQGAPWHTPVRQLSQNVFWMSLDLAPLRFHRSPPKLELNWSPLGATRLGLRDSPAPVHPPDLRRTSTRKWKGQRLPHRSGIHPKLRNHQVLVNLLLPSRALALRGPKT